MKQTLKKRFIFRVSDEINEEIMKLKKEESLKCAELFRDLLGRYLKKRKRVA